MAYHALVGFALDLAQIQATGLVMPDEHEDVGLDLGRPRQRDCIDAVDHLAAEACTQRVVGVSGFPIQ